jgi:signal peptidase I
LTPKRFTAINKRLPVIIVLAVLAGLGIRKFLLEGVYVASGSMEPTLPINTHYFVNRLIYHFRHPQRGEIIVFTSPVDAQKGMIKRVIAVGGDQVQLQNKRVMINGQPVFEPYAVYKRANERLVGDNTPPLTVPQDAYFVLGDKRDESDDSSMWKDAATGNHLYFVKKDLLEGKLIIP